MLFIAACDVYVPMISGRGLGHTGGTLDKFDSIPGYNTSPDIKKFRDVVKEVGCAIIGQTSNLAPADKKLYAIRDIVGTVESIPLIISSILSKKIAAGLTNLILDVKVGNGSFNKNEKVASELAISTVNVAREAGLNCSAILTDMNQVLGWCAGHSLEVIESIEYLIGIKKNKRLKNIATELTCSLLMTTKKISEIEALKQVETVINNGKAAEKFEKMISALGGPKDLLKSFNSYLPKASFKKEIFSKNRGFINSIDTRKLGLLLIELGGGRKQMNDKIDYSVGFKTLLEVGSVVDNNTPLLKVYAKSKEDFDKVKEQIQKCFSITDQKVEPLKTIYKKI